MCLYHSVSCQKSASDWHRLKSEGGRETGRGLTYEKVCHYACWKFSLELALFVALLNVIERNG